MLRSRRQPRCPLSLRLPAAVGLWLGLSVGCLPSAHADAPAARPATPTVRPAVRPIGTEEEASAARVDLDYLPEDHPGREPLRRELLRYYTTEAREALQNQHRDDAYEQFTAALTLFDARELGDPAHPPVAPQLGEIAESIDRVFRKNGAHGEVVTALMVLQTLQPGADGPRRRYDALAAWLAGDPDRAPPWRRGPGHKGPTPTGSAQRSGAPSIDEPPASLMRDLEGTAKVWPAAPVVQELTLLYQAEAQSFGPGLRSPRELMQRLHSQGYQPGPGSLPAFKLARLYLRLGRQGDAVRLISALGQLQQPERALLDLLKNTGTGAESALDQVKLGAMLAQSFEDLDVGLAMCRDATRRAPTLPQAHLCIAELSYQAGRKGLSLRALERARDVIPGERAVWDKLGLLYLDHLSDLVGDERTEDLTGMLGKIESFYLLMEQRFPGQRQNLNMSMALAEVGRGYFNAGRIAEAVRYSERSVAVEPNAAALELLGTIQLRRGQARAAAATLDRARAIELASERGSAQLKALFRARIGRLMADALDESGSQKEAAEVRRASLKEWARLLDKTELSPRQRAEAELERGKLFYQVGERTSSLRSFQQAIELVPDEKDSKDLSHIFADTISFLVQRGELEESLSAYHRALSRAKVVEYLKVYCSLWVNDLARRAGQPEDPLATAYLKSLQGGKWYAQLARFATGQSTEETLLRGADTVGKRAEAQFYVGMRELGAGHRERALGLLRKVLDSDMMAFFEYEMAARYLRLGAPQSPVLAPEPRLAEPRKARPPGSI